MTIQEFRALNQPKAGKKRGEMNKLEAAFERDVLLPAKLAGTLKDYKYESLKLRLANGAWYTPDFVAFSNSIRITLYEVKGFWREASRVRIKVAAELYPEFHFRAVKRFTNRSWEYEDF